MQQIAYCYSQIGDLYVSGGMPMEAIHYLSEALRVRRQIFPELSTEVLSASHTLANVFLLTDTNMKTALELLKCCLKGCGWHEEDSSDEHILPTSEIRYGIASCFLSLGKSSDALLVLQGTLKRLHLARNSEDDPDKKAKFVEAIIEVEFQMGCVVFIFPSGIKKQVLCIGH